MASTNFHAFNASIARFAKENPAKFKVVRDKLALQGLSGVVRKTPVDTGRARGNWQVSTGSPASGDIDNEDSNGNGTISDGNGTIVSAPPFGVVYIANNLPYIERLENGHSKQAPAGMLELTFQELQSQFG